MITFCPLLAKNFDVTQAALLLSQVQIRDTAMHIFIRTDTKTRFKLEVNATCFTMNRTCFGEKSRRWMIFYTKIGPTLNKDSHITWKVVINRDALVLNLILLMSRKLTRLTKNFVVIHIIVASIPVGDWDVRSAVLAGQKDKVTRYFDKLIEEINTLVRMAQDDGKVVTQYTLIFDMGNYNLVEQGCAQCKNKKIKNSW